VIIADKQDMDPETLKNATRLIRALNPEATIADQALKPLATSEPMMPEYEDSHHDDVFAAVGHSELGWIIADTGCARVRISGSRPIHPKRFLEFVKEGWRGVVRGRGKIRLASHPGADRLWSQAGKVGVLGPRNPSASGGWRQDLTLIGPPDACTHAYRSFDACLLSDEEVELGPRLWRSFADPFKEG
jgi:G3E family GTPase